MHNTPNKIFNTRYTASIRALADISRSALCYHSNETHALIANPPNTAQLEGTPTIPKLRPGPCSSVGMRRGTDTQTAVITIYFASSTTHAKCNNVHDLRYRPAIYQVIYVQTE